MGLAGERDRGTGYKVVESGELVDKLEAFTEPVIVSIADTVQVHQLVIIRLPIAIICKGRWALGLEDITWGRRRLNNLIGAKVDLVIEHHLFLVQSR